MLDGMEELTLQVSYLIPFKSCFKGFPVMKSIMYLVAILCVFALCDFNAFMVHWSIVYSEPCQTSKMIILRKQLLPKR